MKKSRMPEMVAIGIMTLMAGMSGAQAQDKSGNGGGAVVCRDAAGKITSADLLDLYEGKTALLRMQFEPSQDFYQTVASVSSKVSTYQSQYGKKLTDESTKILESIRTGSNYFQMLDDPLPLIYDAFNISVPKGCAVEQAAIRLTPDQSLAFGNAHYVASQEIWDAFDHTNKSALVLHESVYKISGQSDSILSRSMVRELMRKGRTHFHTLAVELLKNNLGVIPLKDGSYGYASVVSLDQQEVTFSISAEEGRLFYLVYDTEGNLVKEKSRSNNNQYRISVYHHPYDDLNCRAYGNGRSEVLYKSESDRQKFARMRLRMSSVGVNVEFLPVLASGSCDHPTRTSISGSIDVSSLFSMVSITWTNVPLQNFQGMFIEYYLPNLKI